MTLGNHLKKNQVVKVERDDEIWELRKQGYSLRDIARNVGLGHVQVWRRLKAREEQILSPNIEAYRELQNERIEAAVKALWSKIEAGDVPSVLALVRLMERQAKLYGLDAPPKPVTLSVEGNHAWNQIMDAVLVERPALEGGNNNGSTYEGQVMPRQAEAPNQGSGAVEDFDSRE